jgi:formate hydrogenlyase subunit 3/multisubunit Na+/H+ antiporter MnhD subunit
MAANPLVLLVCLPFVAAVLNLALPVVLRKIVTFAVLSFEMALCVRFYAALPPDFAIGGQTFFAVDAMSLFTLFFLQLLALLILIFSLKGVDKEIEKSFFVWYLLTVSFCNGVVVSDFSLSFLIFWGLSGVALYAFALLGRTEDAPQTAKKTFIIIGGSDAFLLMGLALMWQMQPAGQGSLGAFHAPLMGGTATLAFVMLMVAAFAKAGGFPLHTWVPDFSKDAPVEGAALLPASLDKLLGIYLLARLMMHYFTVSIVVNLIVVTLGALTVIIAVMMAMHQHNGRKLLGYHAVSQVGYMIMGVGSGSVLAFAGGLFHLVNHTIYKSNLFLSLGAVEKQTGTNELDELGGLSKVMPFTFLAALVGALSISGIPPFNGFFSKWMIYQGLLERAAGLTAAMQFWLLLCIVLAVFGSALTLASFVKFIYSIFLGKRLKRFENIHEAPINQKASLALLSLLCIGFGLFAVRVPLLRMIYPILQASGYQVEFLGQYQPLLITVLFLIPFLIGFLFFLSIRKMRYDDLYLGGMAAEERFRFIGTSFYNEIRRMAPLKYFYDAADRKEFDVYDLGSRATFGSAHWLQRLHSGLLPIYVLFILAGLVLLLILH